MDTRRWRTTQCASALFLFLFAGLAQAKAPDGAVQAGIQKLADQMSTGLGVKGGKGDWRRIAVMPFDNADKRVEELELGRICSALLSSRLAKNPKVVQVERARLDAVVGELKRGERGELDPKGAASVGKLLGANMVVVGSVAAAGPDYVVAARLVDAETGRIVTAADSNIPQTGMVALSEDVVEVKSKVGAAGRSAVLPGWGQFYNGDIGRGVSYLTLFGGFAAGAIASSVAGSRAESEYQENTPGTVGRREDANEHYDRANLFLVGLGVVWAASVADAWISGRDARLVEVGAAPLPGGGGAVSLGGRF